MMHIDFLIKTIKKNIYGDAVIWKDRVYSYRWLLERFQGWKEFLSINRIEPGTVVVLEADFSPKAIALFLALIENRCIIVPFASYIDTQKDEFVEIAQAEAIFKLDSNDNYSLKRLSNTADNKLYVKLRKLDNPGLVLFSSGSTGRSKAAVHDFSHLLKKFRTRRHNLRTITFLLLDHIGGIDTLLYCLSNSSCIIAIDDRSPDNICAAIEKWKVEVLPVTPTFMNLLILSEAYLRYDLSSLKYITYGTEVMPEATLQRCAELFPSVTLLQKYGTTEVGTLRSKSKGSSSWVKVGGDGFETRIVDGMLQIKAESAMLGYLNAPNPFTEDGWFMTGDSVKQDGEYIRILGRKSEIINVGGEKVYPAEVENVIQQADNIAQATVYSEKNPIMGNIVCSRITLIRKEEKSKAVNRIKKFCLDRLENFKVPVRVEIVESPQYSSRFKKIRKIQKNQ
jgi:acyl-CoA synthetase (AMP-forming)/AMP-acid ligase II